MNVDRLLPSNECSVVLMGWFFISHGESREQKLVVNKEWFLNSLLRKLVVT